MENKLKNKLRNFISLTFNIVNKLPQDEDRKKIVLELAEKLAPMKVIYHQENTDIQYIGTGIIIDHRTFQFKLEESLAYVFQVIENLSTSEGIKLLYAIREVVWEFYKLVEIMIEPFALDDNVDLSILPTDS